MRVISSHELSAKQAYEMEDNPSIFFYFRFRTFFK